MDETHQSCLFTKYQKGQLVKKEKKKEKIIRGLMTIASFMRCQQPIQNYETTNFVHQFIQGVANVQ